MAAVYVSNLVVNAGSTFSQTFELAQSDDSGPLNLDGFTVAAQFRNMLEVAQNMILLP